ncbi:uncharacterized protein [Choristoneura fumiferana]|uniref:uncharacterized protein n=1 Tax=Choristoneura fumiferana TaxID=7141 RepID=UPI003D158581
MKSLQTEIKDMLKNFKSDREAQNVKLYEAIEDLRMQNKEIIKTNNKIEKFLEQTTTMYSNLKEKVDQMSLEHDDALLKINNIENQVEDLQRAQRLTMVEIRNIPEAVNENLSDTMTLLHNSLGLPFSSDNLKQVRRLKNAQKLIIAEFQTIDQSTSLMKAVKEYNKSHQDEKFNTDNMNIAGDKQPIYVSESLTPRARKLHFLARDLRKNHNYKYCWTWQGKILVKQTDSSPAILIKSEQQVEALKSFTVTQ